MSGHEQGVLTLMAPLPGVLVPLEKVPDPVFAQKMVGDGVSIDPTGDTLVAPCDGEISHMHPSLHAVTIKSAAGVEIVLHIGLDTVTLKGEGFTANTKVGASVKQGDPLVTFTPDFVATHAKSLLTQMIVSDMDQVESISPETGIVASGDPVCTVKLVGGADAVEEEESGKTVVSEAVILPNPTGLHARPAAVLAGMAKNYKSKVELHLGERIANAKSITSIMKLNSSHGDKVKLVVTGADADDAIAEIVPQLITGLGDEGCTPAPSTASTLPTEESAPAPRVQSDDPGTLLGVSASPGLATGTVFHIRDEEIEVPETAGDIKTESKRVDQALDTARNQLEALRARLHSEGDSAKAAIFAAHMELLDDPDLQEIVESTVAKGKSADFAWKSSYEHQAQELAALGSEVLAERANDMMDVGKRVLGLLMGIEIKDPEFPVGCIIIAEDLTPSVTANLDTEKVKGFCTTRGGATSHVAILARALGIPAVAGIDPNVLDLEEGQTVVINGTKGSLKTDPDTQYIEDIEKIRVKMKERREQEQAAAHEPAVTSDGHSMEIVGNVGKPEEAKDIPGLGGEGVGLLRSEFIFLDRAKAPTEDEQYEAYKTVLEAVKPGERVVIRTLDVGGDKPLPYLPLPAEENPFLGERGIRVGLNRPEILRVQLRALLRASKHGNLHIMFPMVGVIQEWRDAKAILEEEREKMGVDPVPTGIMIEVPSAAVLADQFAPEVDFFSIGTNDLTQYTLAMDRGHPVLASKCDGLHPAVLRLIKITVDAAHKEGKWAGICGGLGGDPQAVPVLLGLGVDELSVSIPSIPTVKAQIRSITKEDCVALADKALAVASSQEVRDLSPNPYEAEFKLTGE